MQHNSAFIHSVVHSKFVTKNFDSFIFLTPKFSIIRFNDSLRISCRRSQKNRKAIKQWCQIYELKSNCEEEPGNEKVINIRRNIFFIYENFASHAAAMNAQNVIGTKDSSTNNLCGMSIKNLCRNNIEKWNLLKTGRWKFTSGNIFLVNENRLLNIDLILRHSLWTNESRLELMSRN